MRPDQEHSSLTGFIARPQYGYDLANRLNSITYPGGANVVSRGYDASGRLTSVKDWLANTTTFAYDADSNLTGTTYPNSTKATNTYNAADQLVQIADTTGTKNTVFLNLAYSRDAAGEITAENSQAFGYDAINQLTSAAPNGSATTYAYDAGDHLTSIAVSGSTTTSLTYDSSDEASAYTKMNGSTLITKYSYGYDANGNRTNRTDQSNASIASTWNGANRLTGYGTTSAYKYDADGLRVSKTVSGTTTSETWDVAEGLPLLVTDGSLSYVTGPGGLPLEQITASKAVYWYLQDELGSTRAMTDSRGSSVETYTFDPYGNTVSSSGTISNPFQFGGQYLDSESSLYYVRSRYYDPSIGSFISADPATPSTRERYTYADDSPINNIDPTGLFCISIMGIQVGGDCASARPKESPGHPWLDLEQDSVTKRINWNARVVGASPKGGYGTFTCFVFANGREVANCGFPYFGAAGSIWRKGSEDCEIGVWVMDGKTYRGGRGAMDVRTLPVGDCRGAKRNPNGKPGGPPSPVPMPIPFDFSGCDFE